jgi:carbon-monoxide dehydrogenase medium subunit
MTTAAGPDFRSMTSVAETLATLAELGAEGRVLAGGTDLMMQLRAGDVSPATLIHIERVPGLADIASDGGLTLGALVTHRQISRSDLMVRQYPALAVAGAQVGGWQTQAVGTIAGNIVNASPAADLVPPLLVHGATVTLQSVRGTRALGLDTFLQGRRVTAREPDELVTDVRLESVPPRSADEFVKVGRRRAMEVAIVSVAVRLTLDPARDVITDARIAVGACGPLPFRATAAEHLLLGQIPGPDLLAAAAAAVTAAAEPIDDVRASRTYRLRVLPRVVARALQNCLDTLEQREERAS